MKETLNRVQAYNYKEGKWDTLYERGTGMRYNVVKFVTWWTNHPRTLIRFLIFVPFALLVAPFLVCFERLGDWWDTVLTEAGVNW